MTIDRRRITRTDIEWHDRFFRFVAGVFPGIDAERWAVWRDRGAWRDAYEVLALVDGKQIVSTIGVTRMQLVIDGVAQTGLQLGAVATMDSYRGQGLSRSLMEWMFAERSSPHQPVFLFANESVLGFYPRFGFRHVPQHRWVLRVKIAPEASRARRFDPESAEDRRRLAAICGEAKAIPGSLTARDYYPIALWHLTCQPIAGFWLDKERTLIAVSSKGGELFVHDLLATRPHDLRPTLASLVAAPVGAVAFGFDPSPWCSGAQPFADGDAATHSPLFVFGAPSLAGPIGFPGLAQT